MILQSTCTWYSILQSSNELTWVGNLSEFIFSCNIYAFHLKYGTDSKHIDPIKENPIQQHSMKWW